MSAGAATWARCLREHVEQRRLAPVGECELCDNVHFYGQPRIGSLCTGYGGLDLAVTAVLGGRTKWLSEIDPAPAQVCEVRFPRVPNLGDLTAIDWTTVPRIDVLTAGYPCQPFSHAGKREGTNDERHLWPHVAECVRVLRPRLAVFENVSGHLSLGFDRVLADLAELGFDVEWVVVRASDVGACHQRARLFIVAAQSDDRRRIRWRPEEPAAARRGVEAGVGRLARAGTDASDADGGGLEVGGEHDGRPSGPGVEAPRRDDADRLREAPSYARGLGRRPRPGLCASEPRGQRRGRPCDDACEVPADASSDQGRVGHGDGVPAEWGVYGPAIQRHAQVLGRPAPAPVDDEGRLSARFAEWMMLLPEGWVTDVLTNRTKALRCLGNGVVPAQAIYALRGLLARLEERIAA